MRSNCLAGKADVHCGFLRENRRGILNTAIEIATDMPMSPYNIRKTPCFRWCTNALALNNYHAKMNGVAKIVLDYPNPAGQIDIDKIIESVRQWVQSGIDWK